MIKRIFILLLIVPVIVIFTGSSPYENSYLSPEYICFSTEKKEIYAGYSTSPAIAVIIPGEDKVESSIELPSPVNGLYTEGKFLYASLRDYEGRIAICDLDNKKLSNIIQVGYGPCDMAAEGSLLFVANRFSNDVSVVDLREKEEIKRISVLREPSALSISPDGNIIAVTNVLPAASAMDDYISAEVTIIDVNNLEVIKNIQLPNGSFSLNDIIFSQDGKFIYVTHQIGRYNVPTNQIERGWINTNAISVLNAFTLEWYNTVLLDDVHRGAANPGGMEISNDGKSLYVALAGTHELFMIDRVEMHKRIELSRKNEKISQTTTLINEPGGSIAVPVYKNVTEIESMPVLFKDIPNELGFLSSFRKRIQLKGIGTRQLAVVPSEESEKIYIPGYYSEGIDIITIQEGKVASEYIELGSKNVEKDKIRYGDMLFHDAISCFQHWQSCASCHPGEGRADGLNWDLLNDGIGNPKNTKSLLYSHRTPPAMISGKRADAETAVRAGFKYMQFHNISERKAAAVDAYLGSLEPVPSPYLENGNLSDEAILGKEIFQRESCNNCHPAPLYTDMRQHDMGIKGKYDKQSTWDTPTLIEIWRTAPYMHNGEFYRIEDIFEFGMHGLKEPLTQEEIYNLSVFLLSL